jgi:hypothetical protein
MSEEQFQDNLEIRKQLSESLASKKPLLICRVSIGGEAEIINDFFLKNIQPRHIWQLNHIAGINLTSDTDLKEYVMASLRAWQHTSLMAIWDHLPDWPAQKRIVSFTKKPAVQAQALEPFYFLDRGPTWMDLLKGKSVLIVSPFGKTFQQQLDSGNMRRAFTPDWFQDTSFSFIKPPVTLAGNHGSRPWSIPFKEFQEQLRAHVASNRPDLCLVSCGGYGLPVCDFLFTELGLSAFYVGGALQLFFGVLGTRWLTNATVQKYVAANPDAWVRPSEEERPPRFKEVEGGSYW